MDLDGIKYQSGISVFTVRKQLWIILLRVVQDQVWIKRRIMDPRIKTNWIDSFTYLSKQ